MLAAGGTMTAQFQFVMRTGSDQGKKYPLEDPEIVIGRDPASNLVINDVEVSRKHARLIWQESNYVIEDIGSTNGTFINGERLNSPFVLHGGETISLGENISLGFESTIDPDATRMSATISAAHKEDLTDQPAPEIQTPVSVGSIPEVDQEISKTETPIREPIKKRLDRRWVVLIVIAIVLVCACSLLFIFLFNAPASFWCKVLPFIFNPLNYNCLP